MLTNSRSAPQYSSYRVFYTLVGQLITELPSKTQRWKRGNATMCHSEVPLLAPRKATAKPLARQTAALATLSPPVLHAFQGAFSPWAAGSSEARM